MVGLVWCLIFFLAEVLVFLGLRGRKGQAGLGWSSIGLGWAWARVRSWSAPRSWSRARYSSTSTSMSTSTSLSMSWSLIFWGLVFFLAESFFILVWGRIRQAGLGWCSIGLGRAWAEWG